ncbi:MULTISPECIES: hypothetical protein [Lacticaseibacillus]|uniref:hypothetical protein n=1 Tax=Lacticaseibacillus TaxID=2759736 RepID=UPI00063D95E6|nr:MULTISPECIES: hypothetical protein [Lacticaseibacillus]KLI77053.1 hypothetical protein AAW28_00945 [Lacticaseibacillus casei]
MIFENVDDLPKKYIAELIMNEQTPNASFSTVTEKELAELVDGDWLKCGLETGGGAILGTLSGMGKPIYLGPWSFAGETVGAIGDGSAGAVASRL